MKIVITTAVMISLFAFSSLRAVTNSVYESKNSFGDTVPANKKKIGQKKPKQTIYDLPDDLVGDTGRIAFIKSFNKGKIIYAQTCAKCHDSTRDGRLIYPDFSLPQLLDYEMRFQYPAHQDELRETNITHDELEAVVIFLRYKKKNLPAAGK